MRHQLEQTLDNLRTDHVDIYFFHHAEFGTGDIYLDPAIEAMRRFREEGLIRTMGMRGSHRFALDRLADGPRADKVARFHKLFERIQPDVLAVRDNLLTPQDRSLGIFAFAEEHGCGVLVNKPLAQGLLTGSHDPTAPQLFGEGDHRSRKRWFTAEALAVLSEGLDEVRRHVGLETSDLVRMALWSCLQRFEQAAVLVGFSHPAQVEMNVTCLDQPPPPEQLLIAREIMSLVQARLNAIDEVFVDERSSGVTQCSTTASRNWRCSPRLETFTAASSAQNGLTGQVRVLTWNVQHANATRTHQQVVWLATSNLADVLVLTEVAAGRSGQSLAWWLEEFGYTVCLPDSCEDDRYRVLLACRTGVLEPVDVGIKVLPHRCIAARVKLPDIQLAVVGLYVPSRGPKEKRNVAKRAFQDSVVAALAELADRLGALVPS